MHEILQHLHDIEMKIIKSDNKNNKSKIKGKNNENKDKNFLVYNTDDNTNHYKCIKAYHKI